MARIKSDAVNKASGMVDNLIFYERGGKTYVRSRPQYPKRVSKTPLRRQQTALFKMVNAHITFHSRTLKLTIDREGNLTERNIYYRLNGKLLNEALAPLAQPFAYGKERDFKVDLPAVEEAICAYAKAHPGQIVIAQKSGYKPVTLDGEWPATILLHGTTDADLKLIRCMEISPDQEISLPLQYSKVEKATPRGADSQ